MKCQYDDGLQVDYAGSLRINKGDEVNVYLSASDIPATIKGELEEAALHNSCGELRHAAREVTDSVGSSLPEW